MLTSSLASGRGFRCLHLHKTYIPARSASRLSSINRGIRGESSEGPRGFSARSPRRDDGLRSEGARSSLARPSRTGDGRSDEPRKFSARRDDQQSDRPQRSFSDKPSIGGFDKPARFSARLERRSAERAAAGGSSRGDDDRGGRSRPFRTSNAVKSEETRGFSDRPSRRDDNEKPRSFSDRPPRRDDNERPRSFSDRPSRRDDNDKPRSFSDRPSRRDDNDKPRSFSDRPSRRDDNDKPRSFSDRPPRRDDTDRPRSFSDRPARRDDRPARRDDDERPRSFTDRPFKRDNDDKPQRFSDRAPRNDDSNRERKPFTRDRDSRNDSSKGRDFDASPAKPDTSYSKHEYISVPYTTAASEFLYGLNVVFAALKSRRRNCYTLYIHKRASGNTSLKGGELEKLAKYAGVKVRHVDNDFLPVMDKMTDNRPHNGVILEVSPLPTPVVEQLGKVESAMKTTPLLLSQAQTPEERALHGTAQHLARPAEAWRQPFVLLLDGILDPGNMGNILRTAYFYGVDAVAVCVNTCAPLTSSTLHKAASGATEALHILSIQRPADFVSLSSRNGWRVHAAVAPEARKQTTRPTFSTNQMVSPLARAPSILMMGAEGEGLRTIMKNKASHNVVISGKQGDDALGVDSLNVSAATAVLIEAFMRPPVETRERRDNRVKEESSTEEAKETENGEEVESTENKEESKSRDPEKLF